MSMCITDLHKKVSGVQLEVEVCVILVADKLVGGRSRHSPLGVSAWKQKSIILRSLPLQMEKACRNMGLWG